MDIEDPKGIFKKAIDAVNPKGSWMAFCGGIGLLAFILAVSCRIMDFNPGPLWEKSIELDMEIRRTEHNARMEILQLERKNAEDIKKLQESMRKVLFLSHEKGQ